MQQELRRVLAVSNVGEAKKEIMTAASTWGELQEDFDANGVQYKGMTVVEGQTQVSYQSRGAQLPESEFVLFMMPEKVVSGIAA